MKRYFLIKIAQSVTDVARNFGPENRLGLNDLRAHTTPLQPARGAWE